MCRASDALAHGTFRVPCILFELAAFGSQSMFLFTNKNFSLKRFSELSCDTKLCTTLTKRNVFLWAICLNVLLLFGWATPTLANLQSINQTAECVDPPADLVAWWPLDELEGSAAFDRVGRNHGKYINELEPIVGYVEGALFFDGNDSYLLTPNHSELNFGTDNFTIAGWIQTKAPQGTIVSKWGTNAGVLQNVGYALTLSPGPNDSSILTLQLGDAQGDSRYFAADSVNLSDGEWHYVTATVSRGSRIGNRNVGQLYVDGQIIHTFEPAAQQGRLDNDVFLTIGGTRNADENRESFFSGLMDEVTLFKRALEPEEIKRIYHAGNAGICKDHRLQNSEIVGRVWSDENHNGVREENEQGIADVLVLLWIENEAIDKTTTDAGGAYTFPEVMPNQTYTIQFEIHSGLRFSSQDVGEDDTVDSDVNRDTGLSLPFFMGMNESIDIDAGLQNRSGQTISGTVWQDRDGNGLQEADELGQARWTLLLEDEGGNIWVTKSDDAGNYQFTDISVGHYTITQIFQEEVIQTYPQTPFHTVIFDSPQADGNRQIDNINFGIKRERTENCTLNSDTLTQDGMELFIRNRTDKDNFYSYVIKGYPGFVSQSESLLPAPGVTDPAERASLHVPEKSNVYFSIALSSLPEIADKNAQYQIILTNRESGHSFGCSGRFWQSDKIIIQSVSQPLVDIVAGEPQTVTVAIQNPSEQDVVAVLAIDGLFIVDGEAIDAFRLNDLAVGETLSTTLSIAAGQTISYTLLAELLPNCPTSGENGNGADLRSPTAQCIGANSADGIGQLAIAVNIDGEPDAAFASIIVSSGSNINGNSLNCNGGGLRLWSSSTSTTSHIWATNAAGIISGFIWNDKGTAGIFDGSEEAAPGVEVICACASDPTIFISAITDENGLYQFFDLEAGQEYIIRVEPPSGKGLTLPNAGDENVDSDANLGTGQSDPILLTEGETRIDAGLIEGDINCDGLTDSGDGLWILQADVGFRDKVETCPAPPPFTSETPMNETVCDVNTDDECSAPDAVLILRCEIGEANPFCPEEALDISQNRAHMGRANDLFENTILEIPSQTVMPNTTFTVPVMIDIEDTLGAATIHVMYDSTQFNIVDCQMPLADSTNAGDCNIASSGRASFYLVATSGLTGTALLTNLTFEHVGTAPATSPLTMEIRSLRDVNGNLLNNTIMDGEISVGYWLYLPAIER